MCIYMYTSHGVSDAFADGVLLELHVCVAFGETCVFRWCNNVHHGSPGREEVFPQASTGRTGLGSPSQTHPPLSSPLRRWWGYRPCCHGYGTVERSAVTGALATAATAAAATAAVGVRGRCGH